MSSLHPKRVYKILDSDTYARVRDERAWAGAPIDLADGYVHLSAHHQVAGTLAAHFAGRDDLMLAAFDADELGSDLRWEASRGGALFPHLYAPLDMTRAIAARLIARDRGGRHIVPDEVEA